MKDYKYSDKPLQIINSYEDFQKLFETNRFLKNFKELKSSNEIRYFHNAKYLHYIEEAFNVIFNWIKNNESFLIIPDYDSDWLNSWYIYYNFLTLLKWLLNSNSVIKIKATWRDEWYWISERFFNSHIYDNFQNIITTDLWISVQFPFEFIKNKQVLIFDHHLPMTNILFSIKEIHEYIEMIKPWYNFNKRNFDSLEENKEVIWLCIKRLNELFWWTINKDKLNEFTKHLIVNNFVINYYWNYYSWFNKDKDEISKQNKERMLNDDLLKDEYDIHFESSAWELASCVVWYYLEKLRDMWYINDLFLKLKNIYLIWWCVTAISDVTNLESKNNLLFYILWSRIFNLLRKFYNVVHSNESEIKTNKDKISYSLWKVLFQDNKLSVWHLRWLLKQNIKVEYNDKIINEYIDQLLNYLNFYLSFNKDFDKTSLWFAIWPYVNSYWRLITPHWLFEQMILWVERNEKLNIRRKELEAEYTKYVIEQLKEDKYNVKVFWIKQDRNFDDEYNILRKRYNDKNTLFVDYTDCKESNKSIVELEDEIYNIWWINWLIASKVQNYYRKPAIIWNYDDMWNIWCSWRTSFSFIDYWVWLFKSVNSIWWHKKAFWININNIDLFRKEYEELLERLWDKQVQQLYCKDYQFLIEVDNFDDYQKIQKELDELKWLFEYKISFKKIMQNVNKNELNISTFNNWKWCTIVFNDNVLYKTFDFKEIFMNYFNRDFTIEEIPEALENIVLEPSV